MAEQIVTPWEVKCKKAFDYDKLITQFGLQPISTELLERFKRVTKRDIHPWLARGIFFCHQDLNLVLDYYEAGKSIYLYTGRGPSNDMHLGHMIPFMFTQYLQEVLHCPLVIQMSDEEKFYFKESLSIEDTQRYCVDNIKDIIACGFDPEKTFIFSNFEYGGEMHRTCAQLKKIVNVNQFKHIYGFTDECNIGQLEWPVQQIAPAFPNAFKHIFGDNKDVLCLVPMAIDQSPYFRCARDYAVRLGFPKPAMICGKFLPGLEGDNGKMSSTGNTVNSTLFLKCSEKEVTKKINKHAFSGGRDTVEEHRKLGGDVTVDMSFRYLTFFEHDDAMLQRINDEYSSGRMLSGELKQILIKKINEFLSGHQKRRADVTDAVVEVFMTRKLL